MAVRWAGDEMANPYAAPRRADVVPPTTCRTLFLPLTFLRIYGLALLVSSLLFICLSTFVLMLSAGPALRRHASQFVFHDGLRTTSTFANAVALPLALVLWAARQRHDRLPRRRDRVLRQALVAAIPAYLISSAIVVIVGLTILIGVFGQSANVIVVGARIVTWWDLLIGVQSTILDAFLIATVAHFYLARWESLSMPRSIKILGALGLAVGAHVSLFQLIS